jgi:acyl homoserine lactone synthase
MGQIEQVRTSRADMVFPALDAVETHKPLPKTEPAISKPIVSPQGQMRVSVLSFRTMHHFGDLFVNYLEARHDVFIGQRGWNLPEVDGMEFDQYDTPLARFIIVHEFGEILAGIRISPTTAKVGIYSYMIRDAQLDLLKDLPLDVLFFPAPVSEQIWEASRLFVAKSVPAVRRAQVQRMLMTAMAGAAREVGATQVIGIVPAVFRRWLQRIGMTATPVGPEMMIDDVRTCAALFTVTDFAT